MAAHPLDGVAAKMDRAQEHLEALYAEIPGFVDKKPHEFQGLLDPKARRYSVYVKIREDPPVAWSIIVGDMVHNLRSALDHLAWQLVVVSGKMPSARTQFPIFTVKPSSQQQRRSWQRMVKGMRDDILWAVKAVQPYTTPHGAQDTSLAIIQALSNEDKHRLPVACYAAVQAHDTGTLKITGVQDVEAVGYNVTFGRPLKDGDEILWSPVRITGPDPRMEVEGTLPFNVAFGKVLVDGQGLAELIEHVNRLMTLFGTQFFAA